LDCGYEKGGIGVDSSVLSVLHLKKSFGKKKVLHNLSFDLERGKVTALIGENGAGKTTIMKTVLGISEFSGSIKLDKQSVFVHDHRALDSVGALIEYPGLYGYLTAREQLMLFATGNDKKSKVDDVLNKLHMTGYADEKTASYSLGMRQKMGIALALVNKPMLVILDEPMNGLDPKANKELRDLIAEEKAQGVSFLISSHILTELQKIADDVIVIDKGNLIFAGTMSQILDNGKHFIEIQTDKDEVAQQLLNEAGYQTDLDQGQLRVLVKDDSLNHLLTTLLDQDLTIKRIYEQPADLETSVFNAIGE